MSRVEISAGSTDNTLSLVQFSARSTCTYLYFRLRRHTVDADYELFIQAGPEDAQGLLFRKLIILILYTPGGRTVFRINIILYPGLWSRKSLRKKPEPEQLDAENMKAK